MTSLLDGLMDSRLVSAVTWLIVAVIALIVVQTAYRIVRMLTSGTYIAGGRDRRTRLAVLDAAAVDDRRRLVLVRRDDVEHLILIGGPTDLVVEQDIRIGARPARPVAPDADHAIDAYDHGDQALPISPAPPRQPNRPAERQPAPRAAAPSRPAQVEPAPVAPPPPPVAARPVAPVPPAPVRQPMAPVAPVAPMAPVAQVPSSSQQRSIRPVMPRVTLPAAASPGSAQPAEDHRDPPMSARVTPHPARAQANRRAQQPPQPRPQPQPQLVPAAPEADLDDALLQELETSLRYPARERPRNKAADIDDEMNKLLGEMSRDRR